jgi:hypothetical protein
MELSKEKQMGKLHFVLSPGYYLVSYFFGSSFH